MQFQVIRSGRLDLWKKEDGILLHSKGVFPVSNPGPGALFLVKLFRVSRVFGQNQGLCVRDVHRPF